VELRGEYDLNRRHEVTLLFGSLEPGAPAAVDLSDVTYVDSSFLHALTALHFRFKEWGVTLLGVRPPVRRVLQMMNFERLFTILEAEPEP
jgi:anti-sigma B factor antagonist